MRTDLVVVSTPSLAFSACLVEAEEPVGVQALGAELAVQALDEGVVDRLAGPAEVERDAAQLGPQIELAADALRIVVDADRLRVADREGSLLERRHDVGAAVAVSNVDRRRQPREGVDHGQTRILRPSNSWSWTKSIAQIWVPARPGDGDLFGQQSRLQPAGRRDHADQSDPAGRDRGGLAADDGTDSTSTTPRRCAAPSV